jgi:hypothetical protein
MRYELVLPLKTIAHTNERGHWRARARRVKAEREMTRLAWLAAGQPVPSWPAVVTITRIAPRPLDAGDNLPSASKAIRDELVACWGLADDGGDEVRWQYEQARGGVREYAVRIEISAETITRAATESTAHPKEKKMPKQQEFPTMKRPRNQEIEDAADVYREKRDQRADMSKAEASARASLEAAMRKHNLDVYVDPDKRFEVRLEKKEKARLVDLEAATEYEEQGAGEPVSLADAKKSRRAAQRALQDRGAPVGQ